MEIQQDPVPQDRVCQLLNVLYRDVVTPIDEPQRLGAEDQELGRPQARAVADILIYEIAIELQELMTKPAPKQKFMMASSLNCRSLRETCGLVG